MTYFEGFNLEEKKYQNLEEFQENIKKMFKL